MSETGDYAQRNHDRMLLLGVHTMPCEVCERKSADAQILRGKLRKTSTFFNDPIAAKITRRISEAAEKLMAGETQETTMPTPEQLENRFMSDVLRHVVCDCGNYRHHGVDWMPDGSGEGKKEALELMRNYFAKARLQDWVDGTSELRAALREKESELATAKQELDQSDRDCMYIKSVLVGEKVRNQALSRELERLRTEIKT